MEKELYTKMPPTQVFDGFCHRQYDENTDGWMCEQLDASEVPSVRMAEDILDLFGEVNALRRENWQLKKDLKFERGMDKLKS